MSSLSLWSDDKAGVVAEWQKHAYPLGPVGADGMVPDGYVVQIALAREGIVVTKSKSIRCKDAPEAIKTAYKKAHEIHTNRVLEALDGGGSYESPELGLTVSRSGDGFAVIHSTESTKVPGKVAEQVIAVFGTAKKAAKLAGLLEVEVAEVQYQLEEMAKGGEIPADIGSFGALHAHFDANLLVNDTALERHGFKTGAPDEDEAYCGAFNAVHRAVDRWLADGGLMDRVRYGIPDGVRPYEVVRTLRSEGFYENNDLSLTIEKDGNAFKVVHHVMDKDAGKIGSQVIAVTNDRNAAKLVRDLEKRATDLRVDLYVLMYRGEIPPTVTSVNELHEHMDANMLTEGKLGGIGISSGAPDYTEAWCGAINAIHNSLDHWLATDALQEAWNRRQQTGMAR